MLPFAGFGECAGSSTGYFALILYENRDRAQRLAAGSSQAAGAMFYEYFYAAQNFNHATK